MTNTQFIEVLLWLFVIGNTTMVLGFVLRGFDV